MIKYGLQLMDDIDDDYIDLVENAVGNDYGHSISATTHRRPVSISQHYE